MWVRKVHNRIIQKSPYDWARFIIQRGKESLESAGKRLGNLRGAGHLRILRAATDEHPAPLRLDRSSDPDVQFAVG